MKSALFILILAMAIAGPAQAWLLEQNAPNPFCNIPGEPGYSLTEFQFTLDAQGFVQLAVLSEDSLSVVRQLAGGLFDSGNYSISWNGTDTAGELLTPGDYPYTLEVHSEAGGDLLFSDMKTASIYCAVAAGEEDWSTVKPLYKD